MTQPAALVEAAIPALGLVSKTAPIRAALYLRVSTRADKRDDDAARQRKRQDVENQRRQLREFCETQGWQIVAEYIDEESGAKSDRTGFQRMWQDAAQRRFDVLLF
jgi:site-specific DNA recombinase